MPFDYNIYVETNSISTALFRRLEECRLNYPQLQKLESDLSSLIHFSEVEILKYKNKDSDLESEYRRRRCILKRIADGLAWAAFGFDPDFIYESSREPSPGFMGNKEGYQLERHVLEISLQIDRVKFILQNDITNCIRNKGDLTYLFTDNSVMPLEIKSSLRGQRDHINKMERLMQEFKEDVSLNIYNPVSVNDYNWDKLLSLYEKSKEKGFAYDIIDDIVFAIYHEYPFPLSEEDATTMLSHPFFKDHYTKIFELSDSFKYKENSELNYILPPTAFNIKSEVISNIFNETHNVKIIIDLTKLKEKIESQIKCIVEFDENNNIYCTLLDCPEMDKLEIKISHRQLLPVIYSFQKSDCLIRIIRDISDNYTSYIKEYEKRII